MASRVAKPAGPAAARLHKEASVLVCTLPAVAAANASTPPLSVLHWQHDLHVLVDSILAEADSPSLWKFASPNSFIIASGVTSADEDHAATLVRVATQLTERTRKLELPRGGPASLRLCVHSGEVAAGVIGRKSLQYQVYGPVVDVATKASETAVPGAVKVTEATLRRLRDRHDGAWRPAGEILTSDTAIKTYEREVDGCCASTSAPHVLAALDRDGQPADLQAVAGPSGMAPAIVPVPSRWDLRYRSAAAEDLFRGYFNRSHTQLDTTFKCIVILSQLAWVLRWNFHQDPLLGCVMSGLVAFNCMYLYLLQCAQPNYLCHREELCAASHLLHKVAQMMVTITPPGGTIFNADYNWLVALLESSSFAQVFMLTYGLRLRFVWHVPVCTAMLVSSLLATRPVCSTGVLSLLVPNGSCVPALATFQVVACHLAPCAMVYALECRARRQFAAAGNGPAAHAAVPSTNTMHAAAKKAVRSKTRLD